jgi:predicted NAD/FAD-binding protein
VLHRCTHDVAHGSVDAIAQRRAIERTQGERRTWIVGAFLGDGLHEGAVTSGFRVGRALGGRAPIVDSAPTSSSRPPPASS